MLFRKSQAESSPPKPGILDRMRKALGATKDNLVSRIESALSGRPDLDEGLFDDLEEILLGADLGVRATTRIMDTIRAGSRKHAYQTPEDVRSALRTELLQLLRASARSDDSRSIGKQEVWMIVGVNGTGKTTTVGKLAALLSRDGKRVLVCAADTFRPAAIEQLSVWADRSGAELVKSKTGSDPSAVLHDALTAAAARDLDIVLVDTAGRLHTRGNLMQELEKMRRVAGRKIEGAPHEVFLILDATTGQNGLSQAREFLKTSGVTGLIVTKLDGTAKGGIIFSIAEEMKIPVRFVGVGESLEDLLEFSPDAFVESLFRKEA